MQINTRGFLLSREHPPALLTWVKGLGGWSEAASSDLWVLSVGGGCGDGGLGDAILRTTFRGAEPAVARKQAVLRSRGQLRGQGRAEDDGLPDHGQQSPADLGAVASPGPNPGQSGKVNG